MSAPTSTEASPESNAGIRLVLFIIIFAALFYGFNWWTDRRLVGNEAERYEIVKRANDRRGMCTTAQSAAAAALYAKREDDWKKWKEVVAKDCGL